MTDHTPHTLLVILLLLSGLMVYGVDREHRIILDKQMEWSETQWKQARQVNRDKRERWCLQYSLAYANSLDYLTFDPEEPMSVYDNCVRP